LFYIVLMGNMSSQMEADSAPFEEEPTAEKKPKSNAEEQVTSMEFTEGPQAPEKDTAAPFGAPSSGRGPSTSQNMTSSSCTSQGTGDINYRSTSNDGKNQTSVSIVGASLGNVIVAPKNVNLNSQQDVFQKGSTKDKINISGGNFVNATIGGTSTYNITETDGNPCLDDPLFKKMVSDVKQKDKKVEAPRPVDVKRDYSPEQLTLSLLEKGISSQEIQALLAKNHKVENLAFASDDMLRSLC